MCDYGQEIQVRDDYIDILRGLVERATKHPIWSKEEWDQFCADAAAALEVRDGHH